MTLHDGFFCIFHSKLLIPIAFGMWSNYRQLRNFVIHSATNCSNKFRIIFKFNQEELVHRLVDEFVVFPMTRIREVVPIKLGWDWEIHTYRVFVTSHIYFISIQSNGVWAFRMQCMYLIYLLFLCLCYVCIELNRKMKIQRWMRYFSDFRCKVPNWIFFAVTCYKH